MAEIKEVIYDESKIQTLSSLEHIRLRPGMYIGRLGNGSHPSDGIYVLLKEIIDNSVDEFILGFGKRIDIIIENGTVKVRDFGRGIPLGKVVELVDHMLVVDQDQLLHLAIILDLEASATLVVVLVAVVVSLPLL